MNTVRTWGPALIFMIVIAVAVVAISVVPWMLEDWRRCGEAYDRIEAALTPVDLVESRPPGAVAHGELVSTCDADDYFASVEQSYRPGSSREAVEPHYREAALRHGWRRIGGEGSCFEKAGVTFSLFMAADEYVVSASTVSCDAL
ncbi:hypothetical protein [Nonomuraea endophytica]|uniref:Uncharacterized protein n=1 Tax=Nonomuraea endophytica TaxID=714136 RepID=A0A7W8EGA4_9ACTN|nr:hypothetical protein [Nonomuraea endophytica]MBB5078263.1 hypothetical protein [Nonomuraea endophytica]